jgi:hypothetical protein
MERKGKEGARKKVRKISDFSNPAHGYKVLP